MRKISSFIFILLFLFSFVSNAETIKINITSETDQIHLKTIGPKGTFYLMTDQRNLTASTIQSDIEKITEFPGYFTDTYGHHYYWYCRLWAPENMNVVILCTVDDRIYIANEFKFSFGVFVF